MARSTLDLWVGLFVIAGVGAVVILALKVGNLSPHAGGETYEIYAHFNNIGGLKPRAPVKSSGVVVGRVTSIVFDTQKYDAKVTFKIEKNYPFSKDTTASILTSGLLGEQYVGIETGGDTAMLKPGDTIVITQSAVVLEKLIGQFLYGKAQEGKPQESSGNK